jgi:hypothetical protein
MLTGETVDAAEGTSAGTNTSMGTVLAGISSGMPLPGRCCPPAASIYKHVSTHWQYRTLQHHTAQLYHGATSHPPICPHAAAWFPLTNGFLSGLIVASILRAVDYLNARPDVDPDRICIMSGQNLFFEVRAVQHGVRCCNTLDRVATCCTVLQHVPAATCAKTAKPTHYR